ncbi:MAG TPA: TraB/GumN family protein [Gammaproteobacteria bacterium]|nr:TraB/GumN family protein [Gammaproteobacteria bacterium]
MEIPTSTRKFLYLSLLLWLALPAHAQSPVWRVEKNTNLMFIGGTMHVLTAKDYPLPTAFETAYQQATQIVFETDLAKMESPQFQQYMLAELRYSDGRNLRQVLSEDTYRSIDEFFTTRGVPMASVENFKPGMVAAMMAMVELQRLGLAGAGVDSYFNQRADKERKAKGKLETAEEQVAFIASMGAGREDEMLAYNLADLENLPALWQSMNRAWRSGDLHRLEATSAIPLRDDFPAIYQALLIDRNNAWIPQIVAMSKTAEIEFILVGALHLVGSDGLLAMLSSRGYQITQLQ